MGFLLRRRDGMSRVFLPAWRNFRLPPTYLSCFLSPSFLLSFCAYQATSRYIRSASGGTAYQQWCGTSSGQLFLPTGLAAAFLSFEVLYCAVHVPATSYHQVSAPASG